MLLVKSYQNKGRLSLLKLDMLNLLNPAKSDKYRPVRESAAECMVLVRNIPDPLVSRNTNLATFSPN